MFSLPEGMLKNRLDQVKMGLEVLTADPNSTNLGSYQNPLPSVLPGWKIKVITGDTSCSSTIGPLEAVKLHCEAGGKKLKPFFFLAVKAILR